MAKIVVIGTVCIDRTYLLPKLLEQGSAQVALSYHESLGGKGLNQAVAASRAGADVEFYTKVGNAEYNALRAFLDTTTIHYHITVVEGATNHGLIMLPPQGDATIVGYANAEMEFSNEEIKKILSILDKDDILLLQAELRCTQEIIKEAKFLNIFLNPSPSPYKGLLPRNVILNRSELSALTAEDDINRAVLKLQKTENVQTIIFTCGSDGSVIYSKDKQITCPAYPASVIDTTGAGDTYTGYLVAGIALGKELKTNMEVASKAAAYVVSQVGVATNIPTQKELEEWK